MTLRTQIVVTALLLAAAVIFFELSSADIVIEDYFYNFKTNAWMLDRNDMTLKFIFYDGIKKLLIIIGAGMLLALLVFKKKRWQQAYHKGLLIVVLSAMLVPFAVGSIKAISNTPCPKNIVHYRGDYPYVKAFGSYPKTFHQECSIKCFPAGHASGGFALLALFFLFKSRKNRYLSVLLALSVGWSMGTYKMLIGDHFLSHTIVTMILAWLIILILASVLKLEPQLNKVDSA